ncbi:MAG: SoxR reducing system RseC family protein [Methylophilaceae bacterium]
MIEQSAVILALDRQSASQSIATLEIVRKTACGLCGQTRGCGNSIWGKLLNHKSVNFTAQNNIDAKVGDSVIVGIDEAALLKSAFLLYMLPLATMFLGAILVSLATSSEAAPILGAVGGLLVGLLWVKGHTTGHAYYQNHQPKILRLEIISSEKVVQFQSR